ncbi:hypothetical protein [Neptuniibacter halophilus]|uniref:hypothetical protein n=1 Tax=Neptuniibacter halophilus TaxID=651666 RepID=UPI002573D307|nr:hypothetical protein [Neptuniibacter halophilus]
MTEPATGKRPLLLQALFVLLMLGGLAAVLYGPQLLQPAPPTSRLLTTAPGCNLDRSSCMAGSADQQISLSIQADPLRSGVPLQFKVILHNIEADQVLLDLKGKAMYMGINQVRLQPVPETPGAWQGEATLAVCTTGEMIWISSVMAEAEGNIIQADFEFKAH